MTWLLIALLVGIPLVVGIWVLDGYLAAMGIQGK